MRRTLQIIILVIAIAGMFFLSGCTARERAGYSSIPQNTPASWDLNPYGGYIRN